MTQRASDLHLHLDAEYTEKLTRLAEEANASEDVLAQTLLRTAIDRADLDPEEVERIVDSIPGAYESIQRGRADGQAGRTVPLSDLR